MATRTASGPLVAVGPGAITFTTELGDTVTSEVDPRKTEIRRAGAAAGVEALTPGGFVWVTFRPGGTNRAASIQVEPNLAAERALLAETVARAVRILDMEGLVGFSGHVSARLPRGETFLIHPAAKSRAEVEPSDLCEVTLGGEQLSGRAPAPDETDIHSAVYRARADVNCVIHTHSHAAILPALVGKDLIAVSGHGAIFGPKVPVYPRAEKIVNRKDAERMSEALGSCRAVVLRGHGAVMADGTVEAAVTAAFYLEENAKLLAQAMAVGTPVPLSDEELARAADETFLPTSVRKTWDYYAQKGHTRRIFWDD